ncbi:MAG: BrnT family toxin [Nitrospirae bacterium]|nr:BrnT family toxin [Nitrospirota bacterium]
MRSFNEIDGFEWDAGNKDKNQLKHNVHWLECEEVFFNWPLIVKQDTLHSKAESRYAALGKTVRNRLLVIVFTIRDKKIRIISARDMSKKERNIYEEKIKNSTGF